MPTMNEQWIPLTSIKSPEEQEFPPLFVHCHFKPDSYAVALTDLTRIWTETLARDEIKKRALNEHTSIDPEEGNSQLRLLLETISAPLNGEKGVTEIASSSHGRLLLRATCKLPAPLKALTWTYHLSPAPLSKVRQDIIVPLWQSASLKEQQIEDLIRHLKEKDHVISKLLDQLEALNADISTLFPSTAGLKTMKGASKRMQAANLVPGLGAFDEREWYINLRRRHPDGQMKSLDPGLSLSTDTAIAFDELARLTENEAERAWWDALGPLASQPALSDTAETQTSRVHDSQPPVKAAPPDDDETESEDEDASDFQRQQTPPALKEKQPQAKTHISPTPPSEPRHEPTPASEVGQPVRKKLGRIGGASKWAESPENPPRSSGTPQVEVGEENTAKLAPSGTGRKLGRIGGPKRSASTGPVSNAENASTTTTAEGDATNEELPSRARKDVKLSQLERAAPSTAKRNAEDVELTDEEKAAMADRKRNELKRRLQQQAPAKKKRRF
jgi:XLF-Cernunnos, XRcc4-like factor, NHEJ component